MNEHFNTNNEITKAIEIAINTIRDRRVELTVLSKSVSCETELELNDYLNMREEINELQRAETTLKEAIGKAD